MACVWNCLVQIKSIWANERRAGNEGKKLDQRTAERKLKQSTIIRDSPIRHEFNCARLQIDFRRFALPSRTTLESEARAEKKVRTRLQRAAL